MRQAPSLAEFRTRYSGFSDAPDTTVEAMLVEAAVVVSDRIPDDKYAIAVSYLTAHELSLEGFGDNDSGIYAGLRAAGVRRVKDGITEVELTAGRQANLSSGEAAFSGTRYGQKYLDFLKVYTPIGLVT